MSERTYLRLLYLAVALFLYVAVSCIAYRFRHPELTETQLFLAIPQALRWAP